MTANVFGIKRNMSVFDRVLRIGISASLIYIGFIETGIIGDVLIASVSGVIGAVNLLAAAFGVCPVYKLAGISTC